jgi:oxygen-dependent protoporphyrinogen oxidase
VASASGPGSAPAPRGAGEGHRRPLVVVVGAGITGLAAAWELCAAGRDRSAAAAGPAEAAVTAEGAAVPGAPRRTPPGVPPPKLPPEVVVMESSGRAGGRILSGTFEGLPVDLGADAFVTRVPDGSRLVEEAGLAGELVSPAATGALVWSRGRLRPIPSRLVLGVPARLWPLLRSGILSPAGSVRAALEPLVRGSERHGDVSVRELVAARFGGELDEKLVDPILGGINAGSTASLSLEATAPQLEEASRRGPSLLRALSRDPGAGVGQRPQFLSLRRGLGCLAESLCDGLGRAGADIRLSSRVDSIDPLQGGSLRRWLVSSPRGSLEADAVVVTTPAPAAARQLAGAAPEAATELFGIDYASVALITLSFPEEAVRRPLDASGFLVPRSSGLLTTACTWTSAKWPHQKPPGKVLLRVSAGRDGDDRAFEIGDHELARRVVAELGGLMGLAGSPEEALVTRWPAAFPQYRVGHLERVARVEKAVAAVPCLEVAGAALRGLGIPACIAQGRGAARRVLADLGGLSKP